MKVRDLLRKIVNGEDLPQKIKINDDIYVLNNLKCLDEIYAVENKRWEYYNFSLIDFYDNEVEIIEEDKKIEKLETYDIAGNIFLENYCFKYIPIDKKKLTANEQVFVNKINEIIYYINGGTNGE